MEDDNKIYLFDTTLRDGQQTTGVNFSVSDKMTLAKNLDELGEHVVTLAKADGLDAHAMSVSLRLNKLHYVNWSYCFANSFLDFVQPG